MVVVELKDHLVAYAEECDIIVGSGDRIVGNPLRPSVVSNCIQMHHCPLCILRLDGVVLESPSLNLAPEV